MKWSSTFPWTRREDGKEEGTAVTEPIGVKMSDTEIARATEFRESILRNIYIKASDLREHGYTSGCPGCT